MTAYYPVFLQLNGQPCTVIGGGKIAEGKVDGLLAAGAVVKIVSPQLTPRLFDLASNGQVGYIPRNYQPGDLAGAFLVICATDQAAINHQVWEEAENNRQLVNVVDDTPFCNFIMPAVLHKGDLSIAISTAGKAPALAVRLKERFQNELGSEYERFLDLAGQLRGPLAQHFPGFEARKAIWYRLVDSEILDLLSRGDEKAAKDLIAQIVGFEFDPGPAPATLDPLGSAWTREDGREADSPLKIVFATRPSRLARWQTGYVMRLLQEANPGLACDEQIILSKGDRMPDRPIPEIDSKGLFTRELEEALLSGKVDAAVHSLKDLPVEETPGLVLAAIPEREAPYDVLVSANGLTHEQLPEGARIGTDSARRAAQILALRPDLKILPLGGYVDTRIQKLVNGEYDAIILAYAGLQRLGLQARITETFPLNLMLPAAGQGALAVQCRADDAATRALLATIHHPLTASAVSAERAFLAGVGGGCRLPIAAYAEKNNSTIILTGAVFSTDGKQAIRLSAVDEDPKRLGKRLADLVLERSGDWVI